MHGITQLKDEKLASGIRCIPTIAHSCCSVRHERSVHFARKEPCDSWLHKAYKHEPEGYILAGICLGLLVDTWKIVMRWLVGRCGRHVLLWSKRRKTESKRDSVCPRAATPEDEKSCCKLSIARLTTQKHPVCRCNIPNGDVEQIS